MRKFLVVLDDSRECLNAMRFAAMRAANTGGGVEILQAVKLGRQELLGGGGSDRGQTLQ